MKFQIPLSLKAEHEELHTELRRATNAGGRTGEAAKAVAKLMHPHFVKEEKYALPPLGLLTALSQGEIAADRLRIDYGHLLADHAGGAEPADPAQGGGGRSGAPAGQCIGAKRAILLHRGKELAVEGVEAGHRRVVESVRN